MKFQFSFMALKHFQRNYIVDIHKSIIRSTVTFGVGIWNLKNLMFSRPLLSLFNISSYLRENNNVVVFPFPFHIFMPLNNSQLIRFQGQFHVLKTRSFPDLYPIIHPPRRPLTLCRGRILIPGFIRSHPTLSVYDISHSLPRRYRYRFPLL